MFYDQMRRIGVSGQFGVIAILISAMSVLGGCEIMRGAGEATVGGLQTAGKVTVGGLETAGRATVGGLQWVADGGVEGIRGRTHGSTHKPFFIVTGLRFPGIKLGELGIQSMQVVDGRGNPLAWQQGAWTKSKWGPALTITVIPEEKTRIVDVTGVLIYRGGRWSLSARSSRVPGAAEVNKALPWRTELITVTRQ
jgi:hypothetical protein